MPAGDDVLWSHVATRIGTTPLTANSATFTTTESGTLMSAAAALVSGQTYKLALYTTVSASVAASVAFMRIREDSATGTQLGAGGIYCFSTTGNGWPLLLYTEYTAVATAVKTFVVTGQQTAGSGTHQIVASSSRPSWLTVDLIVA